MLMGHLNFKIVLLTFEIQAFTINLENDVMQMFLVFHIVTVAASVKKICLMKLYHMTV